MTGPNNSDGADDASAGPQLSAADLRNARRKARQMGLNPKNGAEAAKMLADQGIAIDATVPSIPSAANAEGLNKNQITTTEKPSLPAMRSNNPNVPAVTNKQERKAEIDKLQARMMKRRNDRLRRMIRRFSMYVLFPTLATTYYLYNVATPLYSSKAILNVEEANSAAAGGLGGFLQNSPLGGGNKDAIKIQNYFDSADLFLKLEQDFDFPAIFMGEEINRFERVPTDASLQERYKTFRKYAISVYDSTDLVLRLEVKAPDPETTVKVSNLMIKYAEEQLDHESEKLRIDELESARIAFEQSQEILNEAQADLLKVQNRQETLSVVAETETLIALISEQRALLNQKESDLKGLRRNEQPNQARVSVLVDEIQAIKDNIEELNKESLAENENGDSIAALRQSTLIAEQDVALKASMVEQQRILFMGAQAKSIEQKKYITESVPPTASFSPIYPKKLTTSLMSFVIFFGLYLFISMTVDVIREQVSV